MLGERSDQRGLCAVLGSLGRPPPPGSPARLARDGSGKMRRGYSSLDRESRTIELFSPVLGYLVRTESLAPITQPLLGYTGDVCLWLAQHNPPEYVVSKVLYLRVA